MKRTVAWEKRTLLGSEGALCVQNYSGRRGIGTRSSSKRRGGRGRGGVVGEKAQRGWRQTTSYAENLTSTLFASRRRACEEEKRVGTTRVARCSPPLQRFKLKAGSTSEQLGKDEEC